MKTRVVGSGRARVIQLARVTDTGHAGRFYGRERALGHVQPRCRGGGGVGRGKGCRLRHRSGGGPPASRRAHGRGRHSAAQPTCARRAGRPTRRTGGRVGLNAARRDACSRSSWALQAPEVAARGHRAQLGAVEGARGQGLSQPSDPCGRTVLFSHVTPFVFSVIATLPTLTRPQIPEDTNAGCHL